MANRYWVGGTNTWNATAGTKWSTTSGGAGGAAVPTSADDVIFDGNSGAGSTTVTITSATCKSLSVPSYTGTITGSAGITVAGSVTLSAFGTWSHTGAITITAPSTLTTAGKTLGAIVIDCASAANTVTLGGALTSSSSVTVTTGVFTTNNYNVTATSLSSSNSNTRTINLGSSTVTLSSSLAVNFLTITNLTFNASTSTIILSNASGEIATGGTGVTFYNVSWTNTNPSTPTITGSNAFNNLTVAGRTSAGVAILALTANQTINGTLTLSAGTNATARTFVRSNTIGTTRTLTCAAVASLADIDFRDITIAGAAAPVSGTRLGDCKGNSGITFPAAKTVYAIGDGAANNLTTVGWATSSGGVPATNNFPLAQDTAIVDNTTNTPTLFVTPAFNLGTLDSSSRTTAITIQTSSGTPSIYGNFKFGTGVTSGSTGNSYIFSGRGTQTITSNGITFGCPVTIDCATGTVQLADALTIGSARTLTLTSGTFDAVAYNVTTGRVTVSGSSTRLKMGSGTWTLSGTGTVWNYTGTNFTVTGTGTISLTSASAKTFAGGGVQTYPTLNQGGAGALTISGSNKFANITNTAIGSVLFTGGTTNEFTAFNLNGTSTAARLTLGSTNTTQVTLKAPSWNVGTGSLDSGNNTGLSFTAGTVDFLDISYVIGVVVGAAYVITANNGTYTVTGQSATLLRSKALVADNGYYNVTGYPATIVVGGGPPIIVTDQLLIKLRSFTETRRF